MARSVDLNENVWPANDAVGNARLKVGDLMQQLVACDDCPLVLPAAK